MTRFTTSRIDPRVLSIEAHRIARQTPARRKFVHGDILAMPQAARADAPSGPSRFASWAKPFIAIARGGKK
jgi:hypothetical protein